MDSAKKPNRLSWQAEWSCFGGAEQAQGRNDLLPLHESDAHMDTPQHETITSLNNMHYIVILMI